MDNHPTVSNAPGLVWRRRKDTWFCCWQARGDVAKRGFRPQTHMLWRGVEPNETEKLFIADQCNRLQTEMLIWSRGGLPTNLPFRRILRRLSRIISN